MEEIPESTVQSAGNGSLVAIAAVVIWALVALAKSPALPIDIPPRVRPWLAFGLGQAYAVLSVVLSGVPWGEAIAHGVVATVLAIGGQELGSSAAPKSPRPPTSTVLPLLLFVGASAGLSGCGLPAKVESALEASRDVVAIAEPCMRGALSVDLSRCSTPECVGSVEQRWAGPMAALDLLRSVWCDLSPESEGCGK